MAQTESGYRRKKSQFVPLKPKKKSPSIKCKSSDKNTAPKMVSLTVSLF